MPGENTVATWPPDSKFNGLAGTAAVAATQMATLLRGPEGYFSGNAKRRVSTKRPPRSTW